MLPRWRLGLLWFLGALERGTEAEWADFSLRTDHARACSR